MCRRHWERPRSIPWKVGLSWVDVFAFIAPIEDFAQQVGGFVVGGGIGGPSTGLWRSDGCRTPLRVYLHGQLLLLILTTHGIKWHHTYCHLMPPLLPLYASILSCGRTREGRRWAPPQPVRAQPQSGFAGCSLGLFLTHTWS